MKTNHAKATFHWPAGGFGARVGATVVAIGMALCGCSTGGEVTPAAPIEHEDSAKLAATSGYPSDLNIYYQNWNDGATYTRIMADTDLKAMKFWDSNPTLSIKNYDAANGYNALRVRFPKDLYGGASGVTAETYLADANEYTLEYKVFFEPGFQFSRGNASTIYGGGKLPGLCGGSRPGGGEKKTDGMSARIMFRKDPTRTTSATGGYVELYHYWRGQAGTYGDQLYLQNVEAGRWYTIKMRVNLGTSTSDGRLRVWVDGVQKIDRAVRYLASGATWKLNGMMFHAFYGGNEASWAPTADTYLMLDNYRVNSVAF